MLFVKKEDFSTQASQIMVSILVNVVLVANLDFYDVKIATTKVHIRSFGFQGIT